MAASLLLRLNLNVMQKCGKVGINLYLVGIVLQKIGINLYLVGIILQKIGKKR